MDRFERHFLSHMTDLCDKHPDPSHDISHVRRVVGLAKSLARAENAQMEVVVPAAYLHDCVYISKLDPRRSQASKISADAAVELLRTWDYPEQYFAGVHHAVMAHSFSAKVPAETLEAKIVQDADRLDAMGAVGIARAFAFSGLVKRNLFNSEDPFCVARELDDQENTLDHFFIKLLRMKDGLHSEAAKAEAVDRMQAMESYLESLKSELTTVDR